MKITAIRPAPPEFWMPTIEAYVALAEAMHNESDLCNANYVIPFAACAMREVDIDDAIGVLTTLRKVGWRLVRDPGETVELGL